MVLVKIVGMLEPDFFPIPNKVAYTKYSFTFQRPPTLDFPSLHHRTPTSSPDRVVIVILAHLKRDAIKKVIEYWRHAAPSGTEILLAYGGPEAEFSQLEHEPKVFVSDPRLRTVDHCFEKQSYTGLVQEVGRWLEAHGQEYTHVAFFECDHWPIQPNFLTTFLDFMRQEDADIISPIVDRLDRCLYGHWLYQKQDAEKVGWPASISMREDKELVANFTLTGCLWRKEAWLAVARISEPFTAYAEQWLGTVAHHLGYRVRSWPVEQGIWCIATFRPIEQLFQAQSEGAWTIHPVKVIPDPKAVFPEGSSP